MDILNLIDSQGKKVIIGSKVGTGGEGAVFDVPSRGSDVVAKIYHTSLTSEKVTKLQDMVSLANDSILGIAAWPSEVILESETQRVVGFLMQKVQNNFPIHHLYNPSHRKKDHPDLDWSFLVSVARNTAAAFSCIHKNGHIIGDVNPNLLFVAKNSIVKIIDCDSFQISCKDNLYLCEVGVPHFTPPELQTVKSFRGVTRTQDHDYFGLSLLIFHLLFMGRHPFAGVFKGIGDMPIEKAILNFGYAFGQNSSTKLMSPPPKSLPIQVLPNLIIELFEKSFGGGSLQNIKRPTANEWVASLDTLLKNIKKCNINETHKFSNHLDSCPWCAQEINTGNIFFLSSEKINLLSAFDISRSWQDILNVKSPPEAPTLSIKPSNLIPKPLPEFLIKEIQKTWVKKFLTVVMIIIVYLNAPIFIFYISLVLGWFLFKRTYDDSNVRDQRNKSLSIAKGNLDALKDQWLIEATPHLFNIKLNDLKEAKRKLPSIDIDRQKELTALQNRIREMQLQKYLSNYIIENENIHGIGPVRQQTLAAYGILTAADIVENEIIGLYGFGENLTLELIIWRDSLINEFVFDGKKGVDPADVNAVNHRFNVMRKKYELVLLEGAKDLKSIVAKIIASRKNLAEPLTQAYREFYQAELDVSLLN